MDGNGKHFAPDIKRIGRAESVDAGVKSRVEVSYLVEQLMALDPGVVKHQLAECKVRAGSPLPIFTRDCTGELEQAVPRASKGYEPCCSDREG